MRKIKIFKSIESELWNLEEEINQWIKETNANVIEMTGNIAPQSGQSAGTGSFSASDVLVILLYETAES